MKLSEMEEEFGYVPPHSNGDNATDDILIDEEVGDTKIGPLTAKEIEILEGIEVEDEACDEGDGEDDDDTEMEEDLDEALNLLSQVVEIMDETLDKKHVGWDLERKLIDISIDITAYLSQWDFSGHDE